MSTFDYIIVGAGTAGCVLAHRLATRAKVLLLEAGPRDTQPRIKVPAAFPKLFKSKIDWAYYTEPEPQLNHRRLFWPRGKVLGGSSAINAMIYIRGHRADYDGWRDAGNPGWGFSDVLPYFIKSENNTRGASEYHGASGPQPVSELQLPNPLSRVFVEACAEIGISPNDDFNGPKQEGAGLYQVTQSGGERWSAARSFLRPLQNSANLQVIAGAHAKRILFEKQQAVGVEYSADSAIQRVYADAEVVLACGAVNSPQLLMLSGIGPADHMRAHGIAVECDLPGVGQNLQDHLIAGVLYGCTQPITLDCAENLRNLLMYLWSRNGAFTSNVAEGGGFFRSRDSLALPDLQLIFGPAYFINHGFTRPAGCGYSIGAILLRPESRGSIRLRSANSLDSPLIQANYLCTEPDRDTMLAGLRMCWKIATAKAFDPYRGAPYLPPDAEPDDEALWRQIREYSQTLYHPVGTCKMGTGTESVVDARLCVHGITNLRIADASIMPAIIGGNTNAPVLMIAEKAAAMMIGEETPAQASAGTAL